MWQLDIYCRINPNQREFRGPWREHADCLGQARAAAGKQQPSASPAAASCLGDWHHAQSVSPVLLPCQLTNGLPHAKTVSIHQHYHLKMSREKFTNM